MSGELSDLERRWDASCTELDAWEKDAQRFLDDERDDPLCEWCSEAVPDGESIHAPYCSAECEGEAAAARERAR